MKNTIKFLVPVLFGVAVYLVPTPLGVDPKGWALLSIFLGTICGIVAKPLPMGAVALLGMAVAVFSGTLRLEQEALGGFSSAIIWLVVFVFFIARGFIKTQLGTRIAYKFVGIFGRSSLGLGYGLVLTELFISPMIPSSGARAGGIIFPIMKSIAESLGSSPMNNTQRRLGGYLTQVCYNGNLITSAMFLTAMAANPMMQSIAQGMGIDITWGNWALAAIVPGLLSVLLIPYVIYKLDPPELKTLEGAVTLASEKLSAMGKMSQREWMMVGIFLLMLTLWIGGEAFGVTSTATGVLGLSLMLLSNILTWDDILSEKEAWHTLIWFSILVMMAKYLQIFGVVSWFSTVMSGAVIGFSWPVAFGTLVLVYFYSHYFFASNTSHVSAMYAAFLAVSVAAGTPPLLAALVLGFCSNLFASMTHYGASCSAIYFGANYVPIATWWRVGLGVSVANVLIWGTGGVLWWRVIGLW